LARTPKHLRAAAEPAACYNHPHPFEEKKWGRDLKENGNLQFPWKGRRREGRNERRRD